MSEIQPKTIPGSEKSERETKPRAPGVSASEEKRYVRVQGQLEENLVGLAGAMAAIPFLAKDALTTLEHAPHLSDAWINICRRDKRMLEATERFMQNSVWLPLVGVLAAFSLSIAGNHGVNLLRFVGVKEKAEADKSEEKPVFSEEERAQLIMLQMVQRQTERELALQEN